MSGIRLKLFLLVTIANFNTFSVAMPVGNDQQPVVSDPENVTKPNSTLITPPESIPKQETILPDKSERSPQPTEVETPKQPIPPISEPKNKPISASNNDLEAGSISIDLQQPGPKGKSSSIIKLAPPLKNKRTPVVVASPRGNPKLQSKLPIAIPKLGNNIIVAPYNGSSVSYDHVNLVNIFVS